MGLSIIFACGTLTLTQVTAEVTDKPQFHSSTFCFRLPSTSKSTTCKFVLRLFSIDTDTNQRSVAGIGVLPVATIGLQLRENGGYKGTVRHSACLSLAEGYRLICRHHELYLQVPLMTKSGELVGQADVCLVRRD